MIKNGLKMHKQTEQEHFFTSSIMKVKHEQVKCMRNQEKKKIKQTILLMSNVLSYI